MDSAKRAFQEATAIFMDLETKFELERRREMIEKWIEDNIAHPGR